MSDIRADGIAVYVWRRMPDHSIQFLQVHRSDSTAEYQHSWQIVYGGIEAGETAPQAALRELKEETGLSPRAMAQVEFIEMFYFRPEDAVQLMPVFSAEISLRDEVVLNEEHDAFRWVPAVQIETHFMWRSQRDALRIILEDIARPTAAASLLKVI